MRILYRLKGISCINEIKEAERRGAAILCKTLDNVWVQLFYETKAEAILALNELLATGYLDALDVEVKK